MRKELDSLSFYAGSGGRWGCHLRLPSPLRGGFNKFSISYREAIA